MSADSQRKAYRYNCNMVRPQIYSEKSLMESVVDFFSDVVPQAYSTHKVEDKEKIQWVRFENCDCSDIGRNPDLYKYDTKGLPLLLILGYSNGVQIWNITPNGEALEILSVRQGPVKICRILPNPEPVLDCTDSFTSKRPLVVMCDSSSAGQPFCGMKFVSLKTGDEVHSTSFKTLPIHNIECNKRFLVVTFLEKICIYESCRFKQLFWITSCFPSAAPNVNPIALSTRWLAYADKRLVAMHQSCGGMSGDGTQSYAATVISAAKGAFKGLSMFGEAMVNSMTGCKPPGTKKTLEYVQLDNGNRPGIVTVVDIQNVHNDHFNVNEDNEGTGLIAHFHAHANEPVADMAFDPTGTLLVTACKLGHNFHIFRLMAHPCSSSLGAVHHLYTLHRGDTTAKVIDIGFNHDSRWVTVSTHRGTTHIFPITPYGGIPNVRTHCQPFVVNRASRFHRSAGLEDIDHSPLGRRSPVLSTSPSSSAGHYDRYPTLIQQNTLNNNMGNPRLPPYPHPITVYPVYQIKQPLNVVLNPGNKNMSPNHSPTGLDNIFSVTSKFCTPRLCVVGSPKLDVERRETGKRPVDCLFVMAQSGTLVEYVLEPKARTVSEKVSDESLLELHVAGRMQWNLQRLKNSNELRPPLPSNSPIILSHEAVISQTPTAPEYYDLPGLTRHDSKDSLSSDHSGKDEDEWVSQVEIITHAGPHRRLWMGPQFSFKTYHENTTVLSSNSSALLSQSSETNMVAMDITGEEGDLESLRVQPTRSNPVSMPNARPAYRRLSSDSSPSPGLSGHSAPLLIEAGSFDQSPHLLDVYSNWTESTVEKQPRGSDDMEEDRIKETLADAMVESPMRDMEKLSLRQDLSRANMRKVTADSVEKRDMVKKESSSSAACRKVNTNESKTGVQQEVRKNKEKGVPVKSDSTVLKSSDKGRKQSLDKTLMETKPTSKPVPTRDKVDTKHVKEQHNTTTNDGGPQNKQKSSENEEKRGNGKQQGTTKETAKEEESQGKQKSSEKLSGNRESDDASLTNIKAKNNVKNGKKKNKSKDDKKESTSIATTSSHKNPTHADTIQEDSINDITDAADDIACVKSEMTTKEVHCKGESSATGHRRESSTAIESEMLTNSVNKELVEHKPKDVSEEMVTENKPVSGTEVDIVVLKNPFESESEQSKAGELSEGKKIERKSSLNANIEIEDKSPEADGITEDNRESSTPEKVEVQINGTKKQRRGKDKKKSSSNPLTYNNSPKSSKVNINDNGSQCDIKEDISNNHQDSHGEDKKCIMDKTQVETIEQMPDDSACHKNEFENAITEEIDAGVNPGASSMDKSCIEEKKMDNSLSWCKLDKKKKKNRKNGKTTESNEMAESITENLESLRIVDERCISPFTADNGAEFCEFGEVEQDVEMKDTVSQPFDFKIENSVENNVFENKSIDIDHIDNQTEIIADAVSKSVDEITQKSNDVDSISHEYKKTVQLGKSVHDISDEAFDNPSKIDVKNKNKQKKMKKGTKLELTEEKKETNNKFPMEKKIDERNKEKSVDNSIKQDIEISIDQEATKKDTIEVNTDISESVNKGDLNAKSSHVENDGIADKQRVVGLALNMERIDSLERSPSFESVRSTLSEERQLSKNDGTDSEVLASTEQSDTDMIEVKSKKKKKKKKANIEDSMYFEAVESEIQFQEDPELETKVTEVADEKMDDTRELNEYSCIEKKAIAGNESGSIDPNQGNIEDETEMFVVKSKKNRKNRSQGTKTIQNETVKPANQEPATECEKTSLMANISTEDLVGEVSSDTTPVNSDISLKSQDAELKVSEVEENPMAWETAGNVPSDESLTGVGRNNSKSDEAGVKQSKSILSNKGEDSEQDKAPVETPDTSNCSSRSSEERDVSGDKATVTRGESRTKKKKKKNRK